MNDFEFNVVFDTPVLLGACRRKVVRRAHWAEFGVAGVTWLEGVEGTGMINGVHGQQFVTLCPFFSHFPGAFSLYADARQSSALKTFKMLWQAQTNNHSAVTFASPRKLKRRND